MTLLGLLAQVPSVGPETTLVGQGVVGIVLGWFMWRNEKHRDAAAAEFVLLGEKIDRLSKVILIQTMTHPDFPAAAESQCRELLGEIEKDK